MTLFTRKKPEPAPAPKRTRKSASVTQGELEDAIDAVHAEVYSESSTMHTLEKLWALTGDSASRAEPLKIEGLGPITAAELDAVLEDIKDVELPASATVALKRTRALLAQAEDQAAAKAATDPLRYVSQQQLEDIFVALGTFVGCAAEEFSQTHFQKSELIAHLSQTAARATPRVRPYLRRLVDAVVSYNTPRPEPMSYTDRCAREAFGAARPRY
jgi:hypothetical protein